MKYRNVSHQHSHLLRKSLISLDSTRNSRGNWNTIGNPRRLQCPLNRDSMPVQSSQFDPTWMSSSLNTRRIHWLRLNGHWLGNRSCSQDLLLSLMLRCRTFSLGNKLRCRCGSRCLWRNCRGRRRNNCSCLECNNPGRLLIIDSRLRNNNNIISLQPTRIRESRNNNSMR